MQRMIMIPVEQYDRMVESYDNAMEELHGLREQLQEIKSNDFFDPLSQDGFVISESMMKHAKNDEIVTLRLIRSRLCSREETVSRSQQEGEATT